MATTITFPIDAVYIWVDGADPAWRARRQAALDRMASSSVALHENAMNECRFQDNGELRYSLRSLARFAPWVRRVYLLTDSQKPQWLDETSVRLVRHEDVFPPGSPLPVFNSSAIETVQHRVPGLAEHFISLNDDFLLGCPVEETDFFLPDGTPRIWLARRSSRHARWRTEEELASMSPHEAGSIRARQLVRERFGMLSSYSLRHFPKPMTVSTMDELWEAFPDELDATMRTPFRSYKNVVIPVLYACWMLASGKGSPRTINGVFQVLDALRGRLRHLGASLGDSNLPHKCAMIRRLRPLTFCLNDSEKARPEDRTAMLQLLQELFPVPSRFEKDIFSC